MTKAEEKKAEILDRKHWDLVCEHGLSSIHTKQFPVAYREQAMQAMDEYAHQEAIGFAEWIVINEYKRTARRDHVSFWKEDNSYVAEQLYDLYLASKVVH